MRYKSKSLALLRELALADSFERFPNMPDYVRSTRNYDDRTANGLTTAILHFLRFKGHQAERISVTGRYLDNSKIVTDTLGFKRHIGSRKWIPGSMQKGSADLSATINGRSVKIEIKMKDKQSPSQKKYQEQIEKAGGVYWLVRSFDDFLKYYTKLISPHEQIKS